MADDAANIETPPAMLATIRPGPVLHVWRDGSEVATVPLTPFTALRLASDLLREASAALHDESSRERVKP